VDTAIPAVLNGRTVSSKLKHVSLFSHQQPEQPLISHYLYFFTPHSAIVHDAAHIVIQLMFSGLLERQIRREADCRAVLVAAV